MTTDRIWGLFFIVTGVAMAWDSWQIAAPFRNMGDPGPGLLPLSLAIAMVFLGTVLILRAPHIQPVADEHAPANPGDGGAETILIAPPGILVRIAVAAVTLGYVALFPRLGFTMATLPFLLLATALLGKFELRSLGMAVIVATTATLLVGWVLAGLVGLPLPGVLVGGR